MSDFRYEVEIDLSNENTSHVAVVDLVGWNRRVLDVGCATGALGAVLEQRGCEVVGIELDEAAASTARERITEVLVGDVGSLDLRDRFGDESFDVMIFADVLEHVVDPVDVLRSMLPLLRPRGFVVISLPNVAHGAIRLALLGGEFRYTDVGLLDRTHLRFFTRESVDELVQSTGLAIVDLRRTTAGVFETEIKLDPAQIPPAVVARVEQDEEATTYQFVFKAVRDDAENSVATLWRTHEKVLQERDALLEVRSGGASGTRYPPRVQQVGVWSFADTDSTLDALRTEIVLRELQRRLPDATLRAFAPFGSQRRSPVPGRAVEALGDRTPERGAELARDLDCALIVGPVSARLDELTGRYGAVDPRANHPATFLAFPAEFRGTLELLYFAFDAPIDASRPDDRTLLANVSAARHVTTGDRRLGAMLGGVSNVVRVVPDALLLVSRLAEVFDLPAARAALPTSAGFLDQRPYVVLHGDGAHIDDVGLVVAAAQRMTEAHPDVAIVALNAGGIAGEASFSAAVAAQMDSTLLSKAHPSAIDVLAVLAGAQAVVTTTRGVADIAASFGVATVVHGQSAMRLADLGAISAAVERPGPARVSAEIEAIDADLDEIAATIRAIGAHAGEAAPTALGSRIGALESAIEAALATGRDGRAVLVRRLDECREELQRISADGNDVAWLRKRLAAVEEELAGLRRTKAVRAASLMRRVAGLRAAGRRGRP